MKILFLTSRLPYPPNRGDKLRVFNFLSRLSKNHSIILLSFIESEKQLSYVEELKKYCVKVETVLLKPWQSYFSCLMNIFSQRPFQVAYYDSRKMRSKVGKVLENEEINAIYVHLFRMAQYAEDLNGIWRILDLCDAVSAHMRKTLRYNHSLLWPVYLMEWLRIKRYERKIVSVFDETVLISHSDKEEILQQDSDNHIAIIPNGVDSEYFKVGTINNHKIPRVAFLGYLSTFYNQDAILYFYHKILPIIKRHVPEIRFSIIGANCPNKLRKLAEDKSVEVFSDIEDTRQYLNKASVFVCPLRVGSGLQNKILEAMAMGLPVVTTSIGYKGIGAKKNKEIIVEDDPQRFANRVVELLGNETLRAEISHNARSFVERNYRWEDAITIIASLLTKNRSASFNEK